MPRLMVDASAWIALYHEGDRNHAAAMALLPALREDHDLWTTGPFVFEAHKRLRQDKRVHRGAAREFLDDLAGGRLADVVPASETPTLRVLVDASRSLPDLSLEDVSGALTMRALRMTTIWAWDEDFRRLGFRVLP